MRTIWFIRHAQSEANLGLPTKTHTSTVPLTAHGRQQAEYVAEYLPAAPDLIVTSPYIRTQQTAEAVRRRFPQSAHEEWPVFEFSYLDSARQVGTTVEQRLPWAQDFWQRNDPFYRDGSGESFADLLGRAQDTATRLQQINADQRFIVVFTHGQFLRAFIWHNITGHLPPSAEAMRRFRSFDHALDESTPNTVIVKATMPEQDTLLFGRFSIDHLPQHMVTW